MEYESLIESAPSGGEDESTVPNESLIESAQTDEQQEEEFIEVSETLNESEDKEYNDDQQSNESTNENTNEEVTGEDRIPEEEEVTQEELLTKDEQPQEDVEQQEEIQVAKDEENSEEQMTEEEPADEEKANAFETSSPNGQQSNGEEESPSPKSEPEETQQGMYTLERNLFTRKELRPIQSEAPTLTSPSSFKKKTALKTTSQSLLTLPKWRQDLLQKNKDEIEFRNSLKNKYKTDVHGSVDGRLKKVDEIKSMKDSLSKTYTALKKPAYEPEGKYVPPPKFQKKIEEDKLVFKKRFDYNSTVVKPILSEVSKTSQKVQKERELEKQRKLEEEKKKASVEEEKRRKEVEEKRKLFKKLSEKRPQISGEDLHKQRVEKAREEKLKLKKKVDILYPVYNPKVSTPRDRPQSAQVVEQTKEKKPVTAVRPQTSQARNHISRTQDRPKPVTKPIEEKKVHKPSSATNTVKEKPTLVKKTSSAIVSKRKTPSPTKDIEVATKDNFKIQSESEEIEEQVESERIEAINASQPILFVPEISLDASETSPSPSKKVEQPSPSLNTLQVKRDDDEESYLIDYPTEDCGDETSPLLTEDDVDFDLPLAKTPLKEQEEKTISSPEYFSLSPNIKSPLSVTLSPSSKSDISEDADTLFIRKLLSEIQSDEEESLTAIQECISSFGNQIFDKGLLSSEDYQTVFSGLQSIKSVKASIVSDLKASLECKNFDEVFESSNIIMFKSAMLDYLATLPSALQVICQNMQTNDVFNYMNTQSQPRDLIYYLLDPVTCLQQQKGKLTELADILATDSVNMFLSTISEVDDYRGDVYLENHTLFKVIELYKDLGMIELMNKKRFLVKEGVFKHENELHEIYLFGDCLVVKAPTKNWLIPFKVTDEIVGDVNVVITKYKEEKSLEIDEHDIEFHMCYQFEDYEDVKSWNKAFTSCFDTLV